MSKKSVRCFYGQIPNLRKLAKLKGKRQKDFLKTCPDDCVQSLSDLGYNALRGNVKMTEQKKKLFKRHKKKLVQFATSKAKIERKRKLALQKGGFLGGTGQQYKYLQHTFI